MLIGYVRVSTTGQNLSNQHDQLLKTGCEKIFEEKLIGMDRKRPQLTRMLREISKGDTLNLVKKYWKNVFWSPSYFVGSCGGAPISIIKQLKNNATP